MTKSKFPDSISDRVFDLCTSSETVSSLLAKEGPTLSPEDAWNKLYGQHALKKLDEEEEKEGTSSGDEDHISQESSYYNKSSVPPTPPLSPRLVQEHLDKTAKCGKWGGRRPSDLFLQVLAFY